MCFRSTSIQEDANGLKAGKLEVLLQTPMDERYPRFSPDGRWIAFTGEYDGNVDVFVMPASGGVPKRLTWHPGPDRLAGWSADGKQVLFVSARSAYSSFAEMYTVPAGGGTQERMPFPSGYEVSMSPDGSRLRTSRSGGRSRCGRTTGAGRRRGCGSGSWPIVR